MNVTLTALAMDGQGYELPLTENVTSIRAKLSEASGILLSELVLLLDGGIMDETTDLQALFTSDEPEVVFVRVEHSGSKVLMWYDRWAEASKVTNADTKFIDSFAWIRLGASLYSLGEYSKSWDAYKQSALISRGVAVAAAQAADRLEEKVWITNRDLLSDPVVGKYMRCLSRIWARTRWQFDGPRALELLKVLIECSRAHEVAADELNWNVNLPNYFAAVHRWIYEQPSVNELRGFGLPRKVSFSGILSSMGGNKLAVRLEGDIPADIESFCCITLSIDSDVSGDRWEFCTDCSLVKAAKADKGKGQGAKSAPKKTKETYRRKPLGWDEEEWEEEDWYGAEDWLETDEADWGGEGYR